MRFARHTLWRWWSLRPSTLPPGANNPKTPARRRSRSGFVLFWAALLLAIPVLAQQAVQVRITTPRGGTPVFGLINMSAVVGSAERIASVTFFVDGRQVARVVRPPFETFTDVGLDNVEHRFRVVAQTASGATAEATVATPKAEVNLDLRVELQQLYAVVSDGSRRVLDLDEKDFRVYDDAREQEIVTFARGEIPFTATVLLDASLSMTGDRLRAAIDGARAFVSAMRSLDEGRLMVFSDRLLHTTPFTNVNEILLTGLDSVIARGGTALNDHLYIALQQLEQRQGRRVVVLLSDGVDSHSVLSMEQVLRKVRSSQAMIYWIQLHDLADDELEATHAKTFSAWRDDHWYRDQARLLRQAVADSGGRIVTVHSTGDIRASFAEVLHELRDQYAIGYYPTGRKVDGSWHRVEIRVNRPGLAVVTRGGYLDS
jgi:Ca-activated chloride channel family protein